MFVKTMSATSHKRVIGEWNGQTERPPCGGLSEVQSA